MIGAGSAVTRNVPPFGLAYGNPARLKGYVCYCGKPLRNILKKDETGTLYQCECGKTVKIKG